MLHAIPDDGLQWLTTVTPVGMIVQGALHVRPFKQSRHAAPSGDFKFTTVLTKLGWNISQVQSAENTFLIIAVHAFLCCFFIRIIRGEKPIFIQAKPSFDGTAPHDDIVFLASGKVSQCKRE